MGNLTAEQWAAVLAETTRAAWRAGDLRYKLHSDQREVYEQIEASLAHRFLLEIARRWGKTWLLVVKAIEKCLRNPGKRVVYGAPTVKDLEEFIIPTFEAIVEDAPPDCRPVFDSQRGHWKFPNGAYVHLFGCDDKRKANRGRGPGAVLVILDECGFIPILRYVVRSILRPQLLHLKPEQARASMLLGSTPAEEPDHDFTAMAERAEANGNYANRTIYDNPLLTPEQIRGFIEEDAKEEGLTPEAYVETDDFRREYKAERVIDKLLLAVPEWLRMRESLLIDVKRPDYFDGMTVLDFGGVDPHFAIFGYWYFEAAKLVVEDEVVLREGQNTKELADAVKAKEQSLWGTSLWDGTMRGLMDRDEEQKRLLENLPQWLIRAVDEAAPQQPWARWCDNDIELARDLAQLHGMAFIPTEKHQKELHVNHLRTVIAAGNYLVNPRCKSLDRHLKTTTWKDHKRRDFMRRGGEHGDGVDCSTYFVRNHTRRNPKPLLPGERKQVRPDGGAAEIAKTLFGGRRLRLRP